MLFLKSKSIRIGQIYHPNESFPWGRWFSGLKSLEKLPEGNSLQLTARYKSIRIYCLPVKDKTKCDRYKKKKKWSLLPGCCGTYPFSSCINLCTPAAGGRGGEGGYWVPDFSTQLFLVLKRRRKGEAEQKKGENLWPVFGSASSFLSSAWLFDLLRRVFPPLQAKSFSKLPRIRDQFKSSPRGS